ncbi:MAG: zinc-binding alcohol dehydrogenase [Kiloniellales bacterium]|nr:zinc-binding alcohol dehydrogenase [Kiloniellales bacterium]
MTADTTEAFWITGEKTGEIRQTRVDPFEDNHVRVRSLYSGISRGTESLVFRGRVPENQYQAMRAPHQEGDFPWPVKYGYANIGRVLEGPPALRGRNVFCLYPHQREYVVPAAQVMPLLDGVPPGRAVLTANMETAVNGLWDAAPRVGDRIAVIGAGTVGCLVAYLARRIAGCRPQLIDIDPGKANIASDLSIDFTTPQEANGDLDLVIHTSGQPAGLRTALALAGFEAAVVEMSWYGNNSVELPLGEAFHAKRLTLRSSFVGTVAAAQRARWSRRRRLALALALLADPCLDSLITGESPFHALPETLAKITDAPGGVLCHRISYPE